jgi:Outer membrane protein and related peptidoglycan-associated (lipo)proteins
MGFSAIIEAQVTEQPQPKFWFGVSAAGNINLYTGTTQTLNSSIKAPTAFHNGMGLGSYGSLLIEYRPDPLLGLMLNLGYDNRGGDFDRVMSPCNCPEDLNVGLSYLTIEPSIRVAPFSSGFYLYVGGVFNHNVNKSFAYTFDRDPDNPFNTVKGDFSDIYKNILSAQVGIGYDIPLASKNSSNKVSLSPFISYHPYFGQEPRLVESWSVSTVRVGLALKFGRTAPKTDAAVAYVPIPMVVEKEVGFSYDVPRTIPVKRQVKETFPLRNYVFFDEASDKIPARYVKLDKKQGRRFKEEQILEPAPKDMDGRSIRQLSVYHNVLNILGKRMVEYPDSQVHLIGSSAGLGSKAGEEYAESVKSYLIDIYDINGSRITIEGRDQPLIPSEQPGGKVDLALLRDGDRRVDIVSSNPDLLTPVQMMAAPVDPIESRIVFRTESLISWSLTLTDRTGGVQYYGPFTTSQESISGNRILGDLPEETYQVVMLGQTAEGTKVMRKSSIKLVHGAAPKEPNLRYSILFDFDRSNSVETYEKFLIETVAPLVPKNGTVIIHGHTDKIGDEAYNLALSENRANDVRKILETEFVKTNKKGIVFEIFGFGSDQTNAPFENTYPEERFYNRTVVMEIVPGV